MRPTLSSSDSRRSSPSQTRLHLLLLLQLTTFASCEFGCLIWGTGENIRYGEISFYSFCDVQYAWGDDTFWCDDRTEPTVDPNDERAFSVYMNHVSHDRASLFVACAHAFSDVRR